MKSGSKDCNLPFGLTSVCRLQLLGETIIIDLAISSSDEAHTFDDPQQDVCSSAGRTDPIKNLVARPNGTRSSIRSMEIISSSDRVPRGAVEAPRSQELLPSSTEVAISSCSRRNSSNFQYSTERKDSCGSGQSSILAAFIADSLHRESVVSAPGRMLEQESGGSVGNCEIDSSNSESTLKADPVAPPTFHFAGTCFLSSISTQTGKFEPVVLPDAYDATGLLGCVILSQGTILRKVRASFRWRCPPKFTRSQ